LRDRRSFLRSALVAGCAGVLAACAPSAPASPPTAAPQPTQPPKPAAATAPPAAAAPTTAAASAAKPSSGEPIRVASILSITGPGSFLAIPQQKIMQILFDELNGKGGIDGRPVEVIFYDDEAKPENALQFAKKAVEQDKVTSIIGIGFAANVRASDPYIQEAKVPNFVQTPVFNPAPRSWTFATFPPAEYAYKVRLDYMKRHNIKKVAMLASSDTTGQVGLDAMKQLSPQYDVTLASEVFNLTDTDVTPQLTKLKATNPDAVVSEVTGAPFGIVAKGFMQLGFKVPLFGSTGAVTNTMPQLLAGNEPDTLIFPGYKMQVWKELPENDPSLPTINRINQLYKAKFPNEDPDFQVGNAYDSTTMMLMAMQKAGDDKAKIRDALEATRGYAGAFGVVNMTPDDHHGLGADAQILISYKGGTYSLVRD
jgi:branched-chain amino acid transport system substrate-binding protein